MPRHLALPAVLLALGFTGCASQQAAVPGYAWAFMNNPNEGPKLAYGRPSSDEVLLMMTCGGASNRVTLTATGLTGPELTVSCGPVRPVAVRVTRSDAPPQVIISSTSALDGRP